jgi:hypothetical protein
MHRQLDGCMVRDREHKSRVPVYCGCPYKPDAIRTAQLALIEAMRQ